MASHWSTAPEVLKQCGNSSVGRAQPCQGWGREFESRFPLHVLTRRRVGRMAMQRIANPWISVRLRDPPPVSLHSMCKSECVSKNIFFAEVVPTRLARVVKLVDTRDLKSLDLTVVPVRVRPRAPFLRHPLL